MQLTNMNWGQVADLSPDTPVVIPIAALEQHGRHMPLFTDSILLGEVVRRVQEPLANSVLFAPLTWLGNSEHHLDFPGTLSAAPRTYLDLLGQLVENFLFHGFRRIVFLNGHGGNIVPSQQALFEVRQRHRERDDLTLLAATYWTLGDSPADHIEGLVQRQMGHACEWETSMMLRINPQLVGDYENLEPISQEPSYAPASRAWITKDRSAIGYIGSPHAATAEKGEALLSFFAENVTRFLQRVAAGEE